MNREDPMFQGSDDSGMTTLQNGLHFSHIAHARMCEISNPSANFYVISPRQICRPFVFASNAHVFSRFLFKIGLLCQGKTNASKIIQTGISLIVVYYELQRILFSNWKLNPGDLCATITDG